MGDNTDGSVSLGTSSLALEEVAKGCRNLERLRLEGKPKADPTRLMALLRSCTSLTALHINHVGGSGEHFSTFMGQNFPALRELEVRCWSTVSFHVASWPLLEVLDVGQFTMSDDALTRVGSHCPHLRSFTASMCDSVTDEGVTAFAKGCAQLQSLKLHGCGDITVAALEAIVAHCRYLEALTVYQQHSAQCTITLEEAAPFLKYVGDINRYKSQARANLS
jgi:hypothetical protein